MAEGLVDAALMTVRNLESRRLAIDLFDVGTRIQDQYGREPMVFPRSSSPMACRGFIRIIGSFRLSPHRVATPRRLWSFVFLPVSGVFKIQHQGIGCEIATGNIFRWHPVRNAPSDTSVFQPPGAPHRIAPQYTNTPLHRWLIP